MSHQKRKVTKILKKRKKLKFSKIQRKKFVIKKIRPFVEKWLYYDDDDDVAHECEKKSLSKILQSLRGDDMQLM